MTFEKHMFFLNFLQQCRSFNSPIVSDNIYSNYICSVSVYYVLLNKYSIMVPWVLGERRIQTIRHVYHYSEKRKKDTLDKYQHDVFLRFFFSSGKALNFWRRMIEHCRLMHVYLSVQLDNFKQNCISLIGLFQTILQQTIPLNLENEVKLTMK